MTAAEAEEEFAPLSSSFLLHQYIQRPGGDLLYLFSFLTVIMNDVTGKICAQEHFMDEVCSTAGRSTPTTTNKLCDHQLIVVLTTQNSLRTATGTQTQPLVTDVTTSIEP